jgi:hypothetical protein
VVQSRALRWNGIFSEPQHHRLFQKNRFSPQLFPPDKESMHTMYEDEGYENESLCIASEEFFLLPEHLEALQEIRRLRRTIDLSGCKPAFGNETL